MITSAQALLSLHRSINQERCHHQGKKPASTVDNDLGA
jgi:hypothetical protein